MKEQPKKKDNLKDKKKKLTKKDISTPTNFKHVSLDDCDPDTELDMKKLDPEMKTFLHIPPAQHSNLPPPPLASRAQAPESRAPPLPVRHAALTPPPPVHRGATPPPSPETEYGSDDYTEESPSRKKRTWKTIAKGVFVKTFSKGKGKIENKKAQVSQDETDFIQKNTSALSKVETESSSNSNEMDVFKHPMCLVRTETGDKLKIDENTVKQINNIDLPMVIVAVVGIYRTGKSYLMNRLAGLNKGFALGNTVESITKGIWVWCRKHPEKTNTVLMLIDTEGLGDVNKGDTNHDNKIFTLATLLCNCLVYNMKGAFDQDAVSKLTFITEISKHIRFRGNASETNEHLSLILPEFVLCLRDFTMELIEGGKDITADEYLENRLKENKEKDDTFNKPRECIRKYFPQRKCFTFPLPGGNDIIANLETLTSDKLAPEFQNISHCFATHIYSLSPKNLLASKPVTGQIFTSLASQYVKAIDDGAIPDVDCAFRATATIVNKRITEKALNMFKDQLAKVELPVPYRQFEESYKRAESESVKYLLDKIVLDKDGQYNLDAQREMEAHWQELETQNKQMICYLCDKKLQNTSMRLKNKVNKKKYAVAGGHKIFQQDLKKMKDEYMLALRLFEDHEILSSWTHFKEEWRQTESEIIDADKKLSEKKKEEERKRYDEQFKKLIEENDLKTQKALSEQRKSMKEHYEKKYKAMEEKIEEEKKKYEEFLKTKLEKEAVEEELRKIKEENEKRKAEWVGARVWKALRNK